MITTIKQSLLSSPNKRRILVIGDINIDILYHNVQFGQNRPHKPIKTVGGTGINASIAFKNEDFFPIIFGKIGADYYGEIILNSLNLEKIDSFLEIDKQKPTCLCNIIYFNNNDILRTVFYDSYNTNDYDINNLKEVISSIHLDNNDYIFLSLYLIPHVDFDLKYCSDFYNVLIETKASIIIDLVPHDIYDLCTFSELKFIFDKPVFAIIAEFRTYMALLNAKYRTCELIVPHEPEYLEIAHNFKSYYHICRFGTGNISNQSVYSVDDNNSINYIEKDMDTGYTLLESTMKRGFGDVLTSKTLKKILSLTNITL